MKIKDILENKNKQELPQSKPRNFVAKNMTTGGAGAHRDKKKEQKQGNEKHKNRQYDMSEESLDETGEITGTVAAVSSDGKQVTVKNADGSQTQTSSDAFVPGPNNTVTMKHNAAGDTLKPGAAVTSDEQVSEEGEDDIFAIAPDHEHIHGETDPDLIGSGHNVDIGGDPTDAYVDQVRDKEFERGARGGREGLAGRSKRISENDELAKMLTIAGLR